jgi:ABC-type nitrate/sulfonate/bicarbonate transport system ATPase subunit
MSARLIFRDLSRAFRTRTSIVWALDHITVTLEPGSFTAFVGPSGCGKSTLLHIAAGLDTQFQGSFLREPIDAVLACLFQQPRLLPWLTARDNVGFVLSPSGANQVKARRRADELLGLVGLGGAEDRFPAQLSGGMQQRVSLARALAVDPDLLLMDEPFSALDELTAARLREEVVSLCAQRKRTIIFVTHNILEACYLADRVVVMSAHPGRIVASIDIDLPRPRQTDAPRLVEYGSYVRGFIEREPLAVTDRTVLA